MDETWSNKSLQATRDGGFSSASRFTAFGPACLSSGRSADMRDSRLQRFLWPVGLIAVLGLIGALALLICPFAAPLTTPALRVLADREFNPPHSLRSQVLSLGLQPIGFVLDLPTVAHVASRDTRHWVYSIISRPDE